MPRPLPLHWSRLPAGSWLGVCDDFLFGSGRDDGWWDWVGIGTPRFVKWVHSDGLKRRDEAHLAWAADFPEAVVKDVVLLQVISTRELWCRYLSH